MMAIKSIIFSLLIVTSGGDLKFTDGFKSAELCEQAKSMALYNMTIEQKKKSDADLKIARAKIESDWLAAHPCEANTICNRSFGLNSTSIWISNSSPRIAECVQRSAKP